MTWFLLFAPILFCAWRSYRKGLFMAIISLCVLAVAYWISWEFAPKIALYVTTKGGLIGILVAVVVGVLLFFLCSVGLRLIIRQVMPCNWQSDGSIVGGIFGALLGAAFGLFLVWVSDFSEVVVANQQMVFAQTQHRQNARSSDQLEQESVAMLVDVDAIASQKLPSERSPAEQAVHTAAAKAGTLFSSVLAEGGSVESQFSELLLASIQSVRRLQNMYETGEISALIHDPAVVESVMGGDVKGLLSNLKINHFQRVMQGDVLTPPTRFVQPATGDAPLPQGVDDR